ncbi:MAG TPA: YggT family protein [Ktedonobacterales bacterium]|nr:YggT family protein [Ktedonobacterales bacterium]
MHNRPPVGPDEPTWPDHATMQPQPWLQPGRAIPPAAPHMHFMAPAPPPYPQSPRGARYASRLMGATVARSLYSVARLVPLALPIVEGLLLVRIVLLLLAANPDAGFSRWIYALTAPLVAPFQGVFPGASGGQGHVLDTTAILAMVVYAIVARVVGAVVRVFTRP